MNDKNKKLDYKTLNEVIKTGNILLKIMLTMTILAIGALLLYLFDKTSILRMIGNVIGVISPLFIGLFLAWVLEPAINYFVKNKVGRKLATVVVYLIFVFVILLILALIVPEFISQVNELISKLPDFIGSVNEWVNDFFVNLSSSEIDLTEMKNNIIKSINSFANGITAADFISIVNGLGSSIRTVGNIFLGLLIGFYLSLDFSKVNKFFKRVVPVKYHDELHVIKIALNGMLRNYVNGTLLSCLFVMILSLIGFLISGVSSPLLFAIFCAITNIIPYFGPYIGGIPVVVVGFAISPVTGIICLVTVFLVQFLEGNILHPLIVGKAISLHPVTIMLSLLIFEYLFGIIGMILAAPIVATLKILFLHFEDKYHFMNKINNVN